MQCILKEGVRSQTLQIQTFFWLLVTAVEQYKGSKYKAQDNSAKNMVPFNF